MAANSQGSNSLGPWGGPGGDPFRFIVPVGSWIKEITVYHSGCINSLSFKDSSGVEYGPFGGEDPTATGDKAIVEIDGNLERLTAINGIYGNFRGPEVIKALSFITNLTKYGPFGTASGTFFSSTPIEGSVVIGFHGRGGYYLDAIGIFVIPEKTI